VTRRQDGVRVSSEVDRGEYGELAAEVSRLCGTECCRDALTKSLGRQVHLVDRGTLADDECRPWSALEERSFAVDGSVLVTRVGALHVGSQRKDGRRLTFMERVRAVWVAPWSSSSQQRPVLENADAGAASSRRLAQSPGPGVPWWGVQ